MTKTKKMANLAFTTYMIEGSKDSIDKIHDAIKNPDVQEESPDNWEGNVLRKLDIDFEHDDLNLRGWVYDFERKQDTVLKLEAEEAWCVTDFRKAIQGKFGDVDVFFITEEPGCDVYVTNDRDGKFFPERFFVDTCINRNYESAYFEKSEDAFGFVKDLTDGKVATNEDIERFNEDNADSDDFIYISEFHVID